MAAFALLLAFCLTFVQAQEKMTFETPKMTEEEQHSPHTPGSFEIQCDACTAIAHRMNVALHKEEAKRPSLKGKPVPESVYVDAIEGVCSSKSWEDYGIKTVNGINRISGEGLEAKDVPGMMQGGGKWPGRLMSKCEGMVGDIGEDKLYEKFRENGSGLFYIHRGFCVICVCK
ncbi:marginal zone B- and B1-cell-specific protein isoform X2 [Nematostella vectensis]|uniref:marginal zone B- and B1-cell-specific protein isoform X2 n=1 Tax=Nematostella vectensis TaxID=45351 RepID=UPI0020779900|nr:marginal zone B- and B1-cell-specific protein isoform X2 [Nematostella vectensis]